MTNIKIYNGLNENVAEMTISGLIVPNAEGKAQINSILRDAWMQVNGF